MKKLLLFFICLLFLNSAKAQYVTIPDVNFVTRLQSLVPGAMNGNQMDTTNIAVTLRSSIDVSFTSIYDLTGIQYFDSLKTLNCGGNSLINYPPLPKGLTYFECGNQSPWASPLPLNLPPSLTYLGCSFNQLTILPSLPGTLINLDCSRNQINNLPTLPNSLQTINCRENKFTSFPILPNSLTYLECTDNLLTSLPTLPTSLLTLMCGSNQITNLPALPNSLSYLQCPSNQLVSLPTIPNSLAYLGCSDNQLTGLPALPNALTFLSFGDSLMTNFPSLPNSITDLMFLNTKITTVPSWPNSLNSLLCTQNVSLTSIAMFPNSISTLYCYENNISCFPTFPNSVSTIVISNNPFNCLPNYITAMDTFLMAYPLCSSGNSNSCPTVSGCLPGANFTLSMSSPQNWDAHPFYTSNTTSAKWYWGDGTSTIGLNPSHTYSVSGLYNVCVTAFGSCGDSVMYCQNDSLYRLTNSMININVINGTHNSVIEQQNKFSIKIYPNPAANEITVQSPKNLRGAKIYLYAVDGSLLAEKTIAAETETM
jgi:Leucine-rich repeat (LRR) protein